MDKETFFARLTVQNGLCTQEQAEEALDRVENGTSETVADALKELGYVKSRAIQQISTIIESGIGIEEDEIEGEMEEAEVEEDACEEEDFVEETEDGEEEEEEEYDEDEEEDIAKTEDLDDGDPSRTQPLPLFHACTQCGREVAQEEIKEEKGFIFFGEIYCLACANKATKLFRLQDARHARATRKLNLTPVPSTPPPLETPAEEERAAPELPLPGEPEKKKKSPSSRAPAVRSAELPPPLPKAASVEEIPEEEIRELEKLISRGKRDLARSRLGRTLKCSSKEAESALQKLEEEVLKGSGGPSRGIFGFARSLARSTSFYLNARRKNWARVVEEGEAWLAEEPDNVDVMNTVGVAYRERKKFDRAEKTFRRAVEKAGKNPGPLRNLADLMADRERWEEALELHRKLLDLRPDDGSALRGLARCARACGKDEECLETLDALIQSEPKDVLDLVEEKIAVFYKMGRIEEAGNTLPNLLRGEKRPYPRGLKWAEKLLAENPADVKGWRQLGRILERRGDPEGALEAYGKALALKPDDDRSRKKSGELAARLGKIGEAIEHLVALQASEGGEDDSPDQLASLLRRAGRIEEAAGRYKIWMEEWEPEAEGLFEYGMTLVDLGRFQEASMVLEQAATKGSEEAKENLGRLRETLVDDRIGDLLRELTGGKGKPAIHLALAVGFQERGLRGPAASQAMAAASTNDPAIRGQAVEFLCGMNGEDPGQREIAFLLTNHFRQENQVGRAAEVLARYSREHAHDPEANRALLKLFLDGGMEAECLDLIETLMPFGRAYREDVRPALESLRKEGVNDPRIPLLLGHLNADAGKAREAISEFEKYLSIVPEAEKRLADRMVPLSERSDDPRGIAFWSEKALEEKPENLILRLRLAERYFERRDLEGTEKHLKAVLERDPENRKAGQLLKKVEEEKRDLHLQELSDRFRQDPADAALGIELGKAFFDAGRKAEGVAVLAKCRADLEVGWKAMEAIYSHYRSEGDFRRALASLKELMPRRRPPRNSREWKEITYRMGDLYLSLADPVRAGRAFFDIYKADPKFRDVKQMMELVEVVEDLVDPARAGAPVKWHLGIDGKVEGPMDLASVKEWIDDNRLSPDDLAWRPGFSGWRHAEEADRIGLLFKYRDRL